MYFELRNSCSGLEPTNRARLQLFVKVAPGTSVYPVCTEKIGWRFTIDACDKAKAKKLGEKL